jgi:hypothetical protein
MHGKYSTNLNLLKEETFETNFSKMKNIPIPTTTFDWQMKPQTAKWCVSNMISSL